MGIIEISTKPVTTNPLKMSQPLGGAMAFLGLQDAMPLFHGSQGCSAFAKTLLVKHFREAIPLQTTALSEVTTILGGTDNLHRALGSLIKNHKPRVIGVMSTGLTETKGEDLFGDVLSFRQQNPKWADTAIIPVSTPDFKGSLEDGFFQAVSAIVRNLIKTPLPKRPGQINILAGSHLTAGDLDLIRDACHSYGLSPIILPDLGSSLDGHLAKGFSTVTIGGTALEQISDMARSEATLVVGASLIPCAHVLAERFQIPVFPFKRLSGLEPSDRFHDALSQISGQKVPQKFRIQRNRLLDAMLDSHFFFSGKLVALALEADLLFALTSFFQEMGANPFLKIAPSMVPLLKELKESCSGKIVIGDLMDLEKRAWDSDLLVSNSHARHAAKRLGKALLRRGIPVFDQLGHAYHTSILYSGTMELVFESGNLLMQREH